jgi:hypothetical protein
MQPGVDIAAARWRAGLLFMLPTTTTFPTLCTGERAFIDTGASTRQRRGSEGRARRAYRLSTAGARSPTSADRPSRHSSWCDHHGRGCASRYRGGRAGSAPPPTGRRTDCLGKHRWGVYRAGGNHFASRPGSSFPKWRRGFRADLTYSWLRFTCATGFPSFAGPRSPQAICGLPATVPDQRWRGLCRPRRCVVPVCPRSSSPSLRRVAWGPGRASGHTLTGRSQHYERRDSTERR